MKKYVKEFFLRGMSFGGFGPIIVGIVYFILSLTIEGFSLNATEVFLGILSSYILAFIHAGASVFNQIESWPIAKSLLIHLATLYVTYITCYLINAWIPFNWVVILIFTAIFVVTYLLIWFVVYMIVSKTSKSFNSKIPTKTE